MLHQPRAATSWRTSNSDRKQSLSFFATDFWGGAPGGKCDHAHREARVKFFESYSSAVVTVGEVERSFQLQRFGD